MLSPPESETQLLERAYQLAGYRLEELAKAHKLKCPFDLKREKGWVGMLLEICLGASAGSKPQQDFEHLGIELKTIPVSHLGKPLETTFVCVAPLTGIQGVQWETSHIRNKLSKVLWIPVEGEREIPLAKRRVGMPILWQASPSEELQLKEDWEELMEYISLGKVHLINAKLGQYLQLRPKAANSKARTEAIGSNGQKIKTLPLGFYLRKEFTEQILSRHFL